MFGTCHLDTDLMKDARLAVLVTYEPPPLSAGSAGPRSIDEDCLPSGCLVPPGDGDGTGI